MSFTLSLPHWALSYIPGIVCSFKRGDDQPFKRLEITCGLAGDLKAYYPRFETGKRAKKKTVKS